MAMRPGRAGACSCRQTRPSGPVPAHPHALAAALRRAAAVCQPRIAPTAGAVLDSRARPVVGAQRQHASFASIATSAPARARRARSRARTRRRPARADRRLRAAPSIAHRTRPRARRKPSASRARRRQAPTPAPSSHRARRDQARAAGPAGAPGRPAGSRGGWGRSSRRCDP